MAWTEFVNGTTADADEVNTNFDYQMIHKKSFSLATENSSVVGATWEDVTDGAFTITHQANALLLSITFRATMKVSDAAGYVGSTVKITGSTLTTNYMDQKLIHNTSGSWSSYAPVLSTNEEYVFYETATSAYNIYGASVSQPLILPDTSTTFQIRYYGSHTHYIKDMFVDITYVNYYTED